jgi:hypothetical protein
MLDSSVTNGSEKGAIEQIGDADAYVDGTEHVPEVDDFGFTPEEQRKIIRRIDRRLVVTVGAMYCVSLMDRTNLGFANIAGMAQELVLIGERYVSPARGERVVRRGMLGGSESC